MDNEITMKIKGELNDFYKIMEEKGFKVVDEFSLDDIYFIPDNLNLSNMKTRDILSKAVLVREIKEKTLNKVTKKITFKIKNIDECGNILSQRAVNCAIFEIEEAKNLLNAIGYKEIMKIKEDDIVYGREDLQLAVKIIKDGDCLIEIETGKNEELNTIEKLIAKVNEIGIPIYQDNYFVKKAEIELNQILKR